MPSLDPVQDLKDIFTAALDRIDPYKMIKSRVRLEGDILVVDMEDATRRVDLAPFERVIVLGGGKASARMARAFEEILGDRITDGLVVVKYDHTDDLKRVRQRESGHPVPDQNGVDAARELAALARSADEKTLVITCISGGGSALLPAPMTCDADGERIELTLADKQETTRALLACGADIKEINCLRKHLSDLKGGRFLRLMAPARSLNFILSDVVGDCLQTIASGITVADEGTFADAMAIVRRYAIAEKLPPNVLKVLSLGEQGVIDETVKPGDPAIALSDNILIGTNHAAMMAAADKARSLGYNVSPLTCLLTGEAREAAKFQAGIARDVRKSDMLVKKPACVLLGGETVVTLAGPGKGGRNQEMALAFLAEMDKDAEAGRGIWYLSASTDGSDGPTDAAGAFATPELLQKARSMGLSMSRALSGNDSYHFFEALDGLYKTGPTMTNVCDLHMILVI
ncbi:MAG: glycerate kinase type-2 family protein [Thermodesulfobacteriota bacterium]